MPKLNDLTGRAFGKLTVIARSRTSKNKKAVWECLCSCGSTIHAVGSDILSGHTASCGCYRAERNRSSSLAHGMHASGTYRSWDAMKTRCTNPNVKSYQDYGAKGITVCERWVHSFENFLADMGERPHGTTLDRIENSMGYEPGNCRWATKEIQQRNTTKNRFIEFNGERRTQAEWASLKGISQRTLSRRLNSGWSVLEALSLTPRQGLKRFKQLRYDNGQFNGEFDPEVPTKEQ